MPPELRHPLRHPTLLACTLALLVLLAAACTSTVGSPNEEAPDEEASIGTIAGNIEFGSASAGMGAAQLRDVPVRPRSGAALDPSASASAGLAWQAPFVPGEVLVKFADGAEGPGFAGPAALSAAGMPLSRLRPLGIAQSSLYRAMGADAASTLQIVASLEARPDVVWAQPNYLVEPMRAPSDALYPFLWHYSQIGLEGAWDITIGSSDVVVAVLDTGMLVDHADAPRNLMSGYDFVSNIENGDGDGRDHDPTDLGPFTTTGYHGSHVVGTVAAAANNDVDGDGQADGIAGVSWRASVLPVRVLAPVGTIADIVDAMVWSIGGSVPGVPNNPDPARVLNLSLGGKAECRQTPAYQDAIDQAEAAGAVVVVAAGNANEDAANWTPASCSGVITVGASTLEDRRASYSNWGSNVALMAPGGDLTRDADGDGRPDGVLSLSRDDSDGASVFRYFEGTSMATPHVSGVVALMLAANPGLTPQDVRRILRDTALPYTATQCDAGASGISLSGDDCGAGRLDAAAAVSAALDAAPAPEPEPDPDPEPEPAQLAFDPSMVTFGSAASVETVTLENTGGASLVWEVIYALDDPANPEPLNDAVFSASPTAGTLAPGETTTMVIDVDRTALGEPGTYRAELAFDTDGERSTAEEFLPVSFVIESEDPVSDPPIAPMGPMVVEAILETTGELSGALASGEPISQYVLDVQPGSNFVFAWSDENQNGVIDPGDWFGTFGNYVQVQPGESKTGVNFPIDLVQSRTAVEDGLPSGISLDALESRP